MFVVAHLVPTGVGAAIGGFAGDAGPATRLLASACDRLVTHPNAVNAAVLSGLPPGTLYVEGRALDDWLAGDLSLRPEARQRIGLLIDRGVLAQPAGTLEANLNAANAVRAVHGLDLVGYRLTEAALGCRLGFGPSGASGGTLAHAEVLLAGARALVADGATAIALMACLGEPAARHEEAYQAGLGVDPIGGLEAILSHLVVAELGVPAAHAPLLPFDGLPQPLVDPRAAAEYLGHTFLPCVLLGLARHPGLVAPEHARSGDLTAADVGAVVAPAGALGGPGVLAAAARGVPVIAVEENHTTLAVTAGALGLEAFVTPAANYLEAAGLLLALRLGLDWRSCRRPLTPLRNLTP